MNNNIIDIKENEIYEENLFFYNETTITDHNFKLLMFYNKFFLYKYITILKLTICLFIIISATILLELPIQNKVFYIFMSVIGFIDTFQVKQVRPENISFLKYEFFDSYLNINNCTNDFAVPYNAIKYIIKTKKYYYVLIANILLIIDKNGFRKGSIEDIEIFITNKRKGIIN